MNDGKDPCSLQDFEFEKLTDLAIKDQSFVWSPSDPMIRAHAGAMKDFLKSVKPVGKRTPDNEPLYRREDLEEAWRAIGGLYRPPKAS